MQNGPIWLHLHLHFLNNDIAIKKVKVQPNSTIEKRKLYNFIMISMHAIMTSL